MPQHARHQARHRGPWWTGLRPPGSSAAAGQALALVAATALVTGAVAQVTWAQVRADARHSAQVAAAQADAAAKVRADQAATARLTGQATWYLALQRNQALTFAEQAVAAAGEVDTFSASLLAQSELDTLAAAIDDVNGLLASTPDPQTALDAAGKAAAATPTQSPDELPGTAVLPITPYGDALELLADAEPSPAPSPTADVLAVTVPGEVEPAGSAGVDPTVAARGAAAEDLTIADSTRLVDAAQRVLDLSAEVQMALSDALDARAATLAAAQAADDAARAAAVEAGKVVDTVEAAKNSPNGAIPDEYLCGVNFQQNVLLRCDAASALEELNRAYRADTGHSLGVSSSYRTAEQQAVLREQKGDLAATPGTSNHGWGLAVDLAGAGSLGHFDAPLYLWLKENAPAYGWHHPVFMEPGGSGPLEPWHWEFDTGN